MFSENKEVISRVSLIITQTKMIKLNPNYRGTVLLEIGRLCCKINIIYGLKYDLSPK